MRGVRQAVRVEGAACRPARLLSSSQPSSGARAPQADGGSVLHPSSHHSAGSRLFRHVETVGGGHESGCHEVLHKLQKWNQHHPGETSASWNREICCRGGQMIGGAD